MLNLKTFDPSTLNASAVEELAMQVAKTQVAMRKAEPRCRLRNADYMPPGYGFFAEGYTIAVWNANKAYKALVDGLRVKLVRASKK